MSFLKFIRDTSAGGYDSMAKAEREAMDNTAFRKEYPYKLADVKSASATSRSNAKKTVRENEEAARVQAEIAAANARAAAVKPGAGIPTIESLTAGQTATPVQSLTPTAGATPTSGTSGYDPMALAFDGKIKAKDIPEASPRTAGLNFHGEVLGVPSDRALPSTTTHPTTVANILHPGPGETKAMWDAYQKERDPYLKAELFKKYKDALAAETRQSMRTPTYGDKATKEMRGGKPEVTEANLTVGAGLPTDMRPTGVSAAPTDLQPLIQSAAQAAGVSPAYVTQLIKKESGFNPNAKNPSSSATGLLQFIDSTAKQYGITDRTNPEEQLRAFVAKTKDDRAYFQRVMGRAPSEAELSLMWQQGAKGGTDLMANPNAKAADLVGLKAVQDNGGTAEMTAAQFVEKVTGYYGADTGANASMTPGQVVEQGTGAEGPGLNFQPYRENPQLVTLDMQKIATAREQLMRRRQDATSIGGENGLNTSYVIDASLEQLDIAQWRVYLEVGLMQAQGNDTRLLNAVYSHYAGAQVEVIPNGNGQFSLGINGQAVPGMTGVDFNTLQSNVLEVADPAYRAAFMEASMKARADASAAGTKAQMQMIVDRSKIGAQLEADVRKALLEGQITGIQDAAKFQREVSKTGKYKAIGTDPTAGLVFQDMTSGKVYRVVFETTKLDGKDVTTPTLEQVQAGLP